MLLTVWALLAQHCEKKADCSHSQVPQGFLTWQRRVPHGAPSLDQGRLVLHWRGDHVPGVLALENTAFLLYPLASLGFPTGLSGDVKQGPCAHLSPTLPHPQSPVFLSFLLPESSPTPPFPLYGVGKTPETRQESKFNREDNKYGHG